MMAYPPFLKLTIFNLLFVCAVGGMGVFTIAFLRAEAQYSERLIVILTTSSVLGAICVLPRTARLLDRWGSRPIMILCLCSFAAVLSGWFCLGSGLLRFSLPLVSGLLLVSGIVAVNFQVANNRLAMSIMPRMGRNHFFAMYTVITNVAAGLSPIIWGVVLDAIGSWHGTGGALDWNRYSIFYLTTSLFALVAAMYGCRLEEKGRQLEQEIGVAVSPQSSGASPVAEGGTPATAALPHKPDPKRQPSAAAELAESAPSSRV
jgi:MFS family permease